MDDIFFAGKLCYEGVQLKSIRSAQFQIDYLIFKNLSNFLFRI